MSMLGMFLRHSVVLYIQVRLDYCRKCLVEFLHSGAFFRYLFVLNMSTLLRVVQLV